MEKVLKSLLYLTVMAAAMWPVPANSMRNNLYAQAVKPGSDKIMVSPETADRNRQEIDSLMNVLDGVIRNRDMYLNAKQKEITAMRDKRKTLRSDREVFELNKRLIEQYESFICDSARAILQENSIIARRLRDSVMTHDTDIRLALVYSTSGLFVEADKIFKAIDYTSLPDHLKALYGWSRIKFLDNMERNTDEPALLAEYSRERAAWRDSLINMFGVDSDFYRKEVAFRYRDMGNYNAALPIYLDLFTKTQPETHDYAMMAKGVADILANLGDTDAEKRYLLLSAITDTRLAVKENESLLALAELLYSEGDIERAYRYMQAALSDANFYNSRFKNAQIARIYPMVEMQYLDQIRQQQHRLTIYIWSAVVLALILGLVAFFSWRQTRIISRSKAQLKQANEKLEQAWHKLAEANLIRERYVGYFMHQCSLSINRLDEFRKNVNRRLKANQVQEALTLSSRPLEKELENLYQNFDKAFLNLYPTFIDEFNALLQPEAHFEPSNEKLNITLRIFALIRLGITDMTQIASFLHYSVQTIYNYKSKVKKVAIIPGDELEERVRTLGRMARDESAESPE